MTEHHGSTAKWFQLGGMKVPSTPMYSLIQDWGIEEQGQQRIESRTPMDISNE